LDKRVKGLAAFSLPRLRFTLTRHNGSTTRQRLALQTEHGAAHPQPASCKAKGESPVTSTSTLAIIAASALALSGCQTLMDEKKPMVAVAQMMPTTAAVAANLKPTGLVTFTQVGTNRVLVKAVISGLKPFAEHGFHIHAVPDCSGDGMRTGGHFNPDGHPHNDPGHILRHAGAMFNIKADGDGMGTTRQEVDTITLSPGRYSIIGLPIITHRDPDDYVSQPLGNAGPRVSCGVIKLEEVAKAK
jgi:superoxide dismutase, Cu-Zn family